MLVGQPPGTLVLPEKKLTEVSVTPVGLEPEQDLRKTPQRCSTEPVRHQPQQTTSLDRAVSHIMDTTATPRSAPASITAPSLATRGPKSPPPKSKMWDTVFSYLTFREPSVQAMKQYEKDLKRHNGRKSAMGSGLPMASMRKLPTDVPKVNTKWDGIPDQAKRRTSARRSGTSKSMSNPSLGKDPYRDEIQSISSRTTGSSSLAHHGSSLWSSPYRGSGPDATLPSAGASTASLTNSVQIYSSGASVGSQTKSDLSSPPLPRSLASPPGSRSLRPNGLLAHSTSQPVLRTSRDSESGSISTTYTTYTTPETPPPVPAEYLEHAAALFYNFPTLAPKSAATSPLHDSQSQKDYPFSSPTSLPTSAPPPLASEPPTPRGEHPFRKLRAPRQPAEPSADAVPRILKKPSTGSLSHRPSDASGQRKRRPNLTLRPKSLLRGKEPDTAEQPPKSAPPDGRFGTKGFLRRQSFRGE